MKTVIILTAMVYLVLVSAFVVKWVFDDQTPRPGGKGDNTMGWW